MINAYISLQGCDKKSLATGDKNMEIPVFEAKCNQCRWHTVLMNENAIQNLSENHMMERGHTVNVSEVV